MSMRSFVSILVLACLTLYGQVAAGADDSKPSPPPEPDEFVEYIQGNMPIIILAPHGGKVMVEELPVRPNVSGRDVATDILAKVLADELSYTDAKGIKRRPHLVINRLNRKFVEPNKSWQSNLEYGWTDGDGKPAKPQPRAEHVHVTFHACADHAVRAVEKEHGSGILLDLHGLSAKRTVDMYGYIIRTLDLHDRKDRNKPSSDEALAEAIRMRSTIQFAASRKRTPKEVADLVRGKESLASLVDQAYRKFYPELHGRLATPSFRYPNPKAASTPDHEITYFNGSYDIYAHSSRQPGVRVDAVQIETTADARNTKTQRARFAKAMAAALRQFMNIHYDLDIAPAQQ